MTQVFRGNLQSVRKQIGDELDKKANLAGATFTADIKIQANTPELRLASAGDLNPYHIGANISDVVNGGIQIGSGAGISGGTALLTILSGGNVGISATTPTAKLDINGDTIRLRTSKTPSTAAATGNAGDIAWDSDYVYVCVATDTWKRVAISTW